jgi:putative SOS response-associated peptidase YedK
MCNFMGTRVSRLDFIRLKGIEKEFGTLAALKELEVMKDGFKYSNSLIIRKCAPADFEIVPAHWEFIPFWVKTMDEVKAARKQGIPWLNATSERLLESKMFRDAALKRRCLVLATHFYEWRGYKPEGEKKELKYPYLIEAADERPLFMAGIWQPWVDKATGEVMDTFAIVTTKANSLMEQIHNSKKRMPTILPEDLAWEWMMEELSEQRIKEIASYQLPSHEMKAHSIAKDFKLADDPTAVYQYTELPAII